MKHHRCLVVLLVGCTGPLTVAELRDSGAEPSVATPQPEPPAPAFGDASFLDANEEPPPIDDQPSDASTDG